MSALPSSLVPEVPTKAAMAVNDKFCKEHPGLCSPNAQAKPTMSQRVKNYGNFLTGLVSDADPAKDKRKKQIAYGTGAAVLVVVIAAIVIGVHMHKKK
jgi:hypothetical protein